MRAWVPGRIVYGVTAGQSAYILLRGQLGYLRGKGWDVHVVAGSSTQLEAAADREGVSAHVIPMAREISLATDLRGLRDWLRLLRRLRPEVVNVSTPKAGLLGGLAARLLGVPRRIYVMRGLRLESSKGLTLATLWMTERLAIAASTEVVVVSHSLMAEARRRRLLPSRKGVVIGAGSSNGVAAEDVAAETGVGVREEVRAELGLSDDQIVVGFMGRVALDKGLDDLSVALTQTRTPTVLLIVGAVEDAELWTRINDRVKVVWVEWTDRPWRYYSAMDVLALITRREGFPNVVLEAGAAGVATITTRATGAVDSVVDGQTGLLVDVGDIGALAGAIERLASDPRARLSMGERARERTRALFRPTTIWSGLDEIYRDGHR